MCILFSGIWTHRICWYKKSIVEEIPSFLYVMLYSLYVLQKSVHMYKEHCIYNIGTLHNTVFTVLNVRGVSEF